MKKIVLLAAFLVSACSAQAAQMSYSDDGVGSIVQAYDTGGYQPGSDDAISILFAQFDTQGGTRELVSVTVTVTQYAWGGYFSVDNDGATEANIGVQHGALGSISVTPNTTEYFLPAGALSTLSTVMSANITLAANDGDQTDEYNFGGTDSYNLVGPLAQANAMQASVNGTRTTGLEAYVGTGDLSLDYDANQASEHDGTGAIYYSGGPASVQSMITVTYEYVPEPTSLALLAAGCAALGLRRRRFNTNA